MWGLSYPSHPDRGRWHFIKEYPKTSTLSFVTLCGRTVPGDWRVTKNFPLMDDSVTNLVCKLCYAKHRAMHANSVEHKC